MIFVVEFLNPIHNVKVSCRVSWLFIKSNFTFSKFIEDSFFNRKLQERTKSSTKIISFRIVWVGDIFSLQDLTNNLIIYNDFIPAYSFSSFFLHAYLSFYSFICVTSIPYPSILIFRIYSSFILHSTNLTSLDNGFMPETSYKIKLCSKYNYLYYICFVLMKYCATRIQEHCLCI